MNSDIVKPFYIKDDITELIDILIYHTRKGNINGVNSINAIRFYNGRRCNVRNDNNL